MNTVERKGYKKEGSISIEGDGSMANTVGAIIVVAFFIGVLFLPFNERVIVKFTVTDDYNYKDADIYVDHVSFWRTFFPYYPRGSIDINVTIKYGEYGNETSQTLLEGVGFGNFKVVFDVSPKENLDIEEIKIME
jgi:hypothetical protein